jgi:UDP-N-acetylglucosamine 1-carboxyvinyltransferase
LCSVESLHGARHDIIADRIEAGSYLIGAVMTGGDVTVRGARVEHLGMLKEKLEEAGATVEETDDGMRAAAGDDLGPVLIETAPHPGFPTDLQAQFMALATQAEGTSTIEIEGVDGLHGARHDIIADRIEAGSYLIGAVMTGGDVTVRGARVADLGMLKEKLEEAGATVEATADGMRAAAGDDLGPSLIETAPHPGFPTDLQAQFMALATQADGISTVREYVFENRFQHVPELNRMGADIRVRNRTAKVRGKSKLTGAHVMATDLRASASLVLAGLAAKGTTVVDRIYHLDRGYEAMESKLQSLGARVERTGSPEGG